MMTIKGFASLCGCNAQTLRYYDKIGLLKPVKVDEWSGYRYYARSQAIDFVKIKNLQVADFTIEEIKVLLTMEDGKVYEAFDRKIAEQSQKLERIKEIQRSYLTEMNTMKKMIHSFCDHLLEKANDPQMLREFGMGTEDADKLVGAVRALMFFRSESSEEEPCTVKVIVDDQFLEGTDALEKMTFMLREEAPDDIVMQAEDHMVKGPFNPDEDMETVWSIRGWSHVHEILDKIPKLEEGAKYTFLLRVHDKPTSEGISYPLFMIGSMLLRGDDPLVEMHCVVEPSTDGQNHFELLRKK